MLGDDENIEVAENSSHLRIVLQECGEWDIGQESRVVHLLVQQLHKWSRPRGRDICIHILFAPYRYALDTRSAYNHGAFEVALPRFAELPACLPQQHLQLRRCGVRPTCTKRGGVRPLHNLRRSFMHVQFCVRVCVYVHVARRRA